MCSSHLASLPDLPANNLQWELCSCTTHSGSSVPICTYLAHHQAGHNARPGWVLEDSIAAHPTPEHCFSCAPASHLAWQ